MAMTLDTGRILRLAAEIRRVDGCNKCDAAELAERLMPFIDAHLSAQAKVWVTDEDVIAALTRLYTSGHRSGHHDTVEGIFTDVHFSDSETYFRDIVAELIADSDYAAIAARLSQGAQGEAVVRFDPDRPPNAPEVSSKVETLRFLLTNMLDADQMDRGVSDMLDDITECAEETASDAYAQGEQYGRDAVKTNPTERAAVPDEKPLPDLMLASYHEAVGWNACRQAMLTSAPQPTEAARPNDRDAQLGEMKRRACEAHRLCYELMLRHPDIAELSDDGELHDAIHDILRVETPTAVTQPPEGARVVDGLTAQTFGEWCNTLTHAYMYITEREPGNAQYGIEKVLNELRAWQRKLAAPTLAGEEGA